MKKFIPILLALCLFASCNHCEKHVKTVHDTVYVETIDTLAIAELRGSYETVITALQDSVIYYRDSSWREEDYLNAKRCAKVNYYISICEKNSSQKKFFYGWIKRTMAE